MQWLLQFPSSSEANDRHLLDDEEGADGEDVNAGAVEAADGSTRICDEGFAKKIKGCVDEDGGGSGLAEFVQQAPEAGIGVTLDGMNSDGVTVEGEAFETCERFFEAAKGSHETAIGAAIEIFGGAFCGDG